MAANDDEILALVEPIHERQKLRNYSFFHVPHNLFPFGSDGIDLIEENDAGAFPTGLVKDLAQVGFALSVKFVYDLGAAYGKEIGIGFPGDCACYERFAASGRAVKGEPLWEHRFPGGRTPRGSARGVLSFSRILCNCGLSPPMSS